MQNLTAHYNILFNANEILRQKQVAYASSFVDNYNAILSVYQDTTATTATPDKDLEAVTVKGNTIINIKEQSKYIGDAYLVLGKANYLEGNFFNAVEYFNYVIRSFSQRTDLVQQARIWKTRTLIYLNQLPLAKKVIDSAILDLNPKKKPPADVFAARLQYDITAQDYLDGEQMAQMAVKYCEDKTQRLRWTFILAQLQEQNNKQVNAAENYAQIAKSNALFEMAFNASLNLIRIEDNANGVKINRIERLLALLKNPNNHDFRDQIYYQVAQLHFADKQIDDAIKNYNLSVRTSVKNQSQKGLSYLRLAEIYFNNKADYLKAKKYYDSTLTSLPTNFPGYETIHKKSVNLSLLADRLQIIAKEDTLQALAKMDEKKRAAVIDKMVSDYTLQQQAAANAAKANATSSASTTAGGNSFSGGSFYFDNAGAVSQGYNDFKRQWGNRKLEDDWRRSAKSTANNAAAAAATTQGGDPDAPVTKTLGGKPTSIASGYRKELVDGIPLTAAQMTASNLRLYNAYVDVADFYRDILDDKKESIRLFELILKRFANDPNKPAIYYSLYRLYSDIDPAKSDFYKNKLLKEFPETPFAKIIIDPEYAKKLEDKDNEFTQAYNTVFDMYASKDYKKVITSVPELLKHYPDNKLSAQLFYLQTIAQGHYEKLGPFKDSLNQIIKKYPSDKLIAPLAKQHLAYIDANQADLQARTVVIPDLDPHEVPFTLKIDNKKMAVYTRAPRPPGNFATQAAVRIKPKVDTIALVKKQVVAKPIDKAVQMEADTGGDIVMHPVKPAVKKQVDSVAKPVVKPTVTPIATNVVKPPPAKADSVAKPAVKPPVTPIVAAVKPPDTVAKRPIVIKPADTIAKQVVVPKPADTTAKPVAVTKPAETVVNKPVDTVATAPEKPDSLQVTGQTILPAIKKVQVSSIFSMADSTNLYFVINVNTGTINLSSSRFGVGQFNRANYAGVSISHQLKAIGDDNQLIFVGSFGSMASVKKYARSIVPVLGDIMKVPAGKYTYFIITRENLLKIRDLKTLNSYIEFYQNSY